MLALREGLRLTHDEIARVAEVDPEAVALDLARARLRLRDARRGSSVAEDADGDDERERVLRLLARRQDGEEMETADETWLSQELGSSETSRRAHAAMLEASVCYRAWRVS